MESVLELFSNLAAGGIIFVIGLVLRFVKGSERLIAGYNTTGENEQNSWNVSKIKVFLGNQLMLVACILLMAGVLAWLGFYSETVLIGSWVLFLIFIVVDLIYINTKKKFRVLDS